MRTKALWILLCSLLVCTHARTADELKSGPQVGATLSGPLNVVIVVHAEMPNAAWKRWDYVEQYGADPAVVVFARTNSDALTRLLMKIDAEIGRRRTDKNKVHALLVMLAGDEDLEMNLKDLAEMHGIKHVSLAVDAGEPSKWNLARDADATIIFYSRRKVAASHAVRKGGLQDITIGAILADLPKFLK